MCDPGPKEGQSLRDGHVLCSLGEEEPVRFTSVALPSVEAEAFEPLPHAPPNYFEDPISDDFWVDIWVACAEHNVGACSISYTTWLTGLHRRRYTARYLTQSQTIR